MFRSQVLNYYLNRNQCIFRRKFRLKRMGSNSEKQGIFPSNLKTYVSMLFQIKGTIRGKAITISIALDERNNYISDEFANELAIPRTKISERSDFSNNKEYAISDLLLKVLQHYKGIK